MERMSSGKLAKASRLDSDNTSKGKAANKSTKWEKNRRKTTLAKTGKGRNAWKLPDTKSGEAVSARLIKARPTAKARHLGVIERWVMWQPILRAGV